MELLLLPPLILPKENHVLTGFKGFYGDSRVYEQRREPKKRQNGEDWSH
jgi:hypothetical protein